MPLKTIKLIALESLIIGVISDNFPCATITPIKKMAMMTERIAVAVLESTFSRPIFPKIATRDAVIADKNARITH